MNSSRKQELLKLIRFTLVGGATFVFQTALYVFFSRWLFLDLPHTASYMMAIGFAVLMNYIAHRAWTFREQKTAVGSAGRYGVVLASGMLLNAAIFWFCHEILNIYDLIAVTLAGVVVPFFTYATHRLWTFHENPSALVQRIVRTRDRLVL